MAKEKSLAGKVSNKGTQEVKALYPQKAGKGSKTTKSGDLRAGKSGK